MVIFTVIIAILALCAIRVPIAVAIGVVGLIGMVAGKGSDTMYDCALALYDGALNFPLLAIPLFILAGALMNSSGISRRLVSFTTAIIGFVRGGLSMVTVGTSMIFAEVSGSSVADVAALGTILIPAMKDRGYKAEWAAAVQSSAASLAIIIPPSMPMIIYGAISDTSIVQLFVAGVVPGLIGGLVMMAVCYGLAVRYNLPREDAFSLRRLWAATRDASWALTLPVIILGGIFSGFVTATEGAGLAVLASLIIGGFIYRELDFKQLYQALNDGVIQTAVVMLLVAASKILGLYLTAIQLPQQLTEGMLGITGDKIVILALINVLLLVLGMFLHGAAAIILVVPILMPMIHQLGIDPVHFGIILTLNLAIGQQTPPVASVLATSCSIARTDMLETTRANIPFIVVLLGVLLLATYVPAVPLSLVDFFYR
jgi:tripartite ATP-independent transporter DctM subunit